jgi:hypothetical protein
MPWPALGQWLVGFVFTQAVEMPLYVSATASWRVAFFASALTHPVVWFLFPLLPLAYWPMVALAELFAVLAEAWWLRAHGVSRALLWSLAANGASATVGLLSRAAFGVP